MQELPNDQVDGQRERTTSEQSGDQVQTDQIGEHNADQAYAEQDQQRAPDDHGDGQDRCDTGKGICE